MIYRLVTRDGRDVSASDLNTCNKLSMPSEVNFAVWILGEWRVVSTPKLLPEKRKDESGELKPTGKLIPSQFATVAKQSYEQTTITSLQSHEVLAEVYRAENPQILERIINPYATQSPTTIDQVSRKPRPSGKASIKRTSSKKKRK